MVSQSVSRTTGSIEEKAVKFGRAHHKPIFEGYDWTTAAGRDAFERYREILVKTFIERADAKTLVKLRARLSSISWFISLAEYLELPDWTGRQVKPGKRGSMVRKVPSIPDRLNLSPELWLQTIAGFAKRRSANSVTPASRFNAAAITTLRPITSDRKPDRAGS